MSYLDENIADDNYMALLDNQEAIDKDSDRSAKDTFVQSIDISEYPKKEDIIEYLRVHLDKKNVNVSTDSLKVNGMVVKDSFDRYLNETRVQLDKDNKLDRTHKGYLQSSDLKAGCQTPRHLMFKFNNLVPEKKKNKNYFNLGEALHACILEPTRFSRYVVTPKANMASNEGLDILIKFWNEQLYNKMLQEIEIEEIAKQQTNSAIYGFCLDDDCDFVSSNQIVELYEGAQNLLKTMKAKVRETNFKTQSYVIDLLSYETDLKEIGCDDKILSKIIKELKLKKNQSLLDQDGYTDPDSFVIDNMFNNQIELIDQVMFDLKKQGLVYFKNTNQKKQYIEKVKDYCQFEEVDEYEMAVIQIIKMEYFNYGGGILPKLFTHAKKENSIYCDDYDGLPLKVRPDAMQFEENIGVNAIISVKSTSAQDLRKFFYDTAKYNYEMSEAMYQEVATKVTGRQFKTTFTLMLQTVEPYGIALLWWTPEDIQLGLNKFRQAHEVTKQALTEGLYPGYDMYAEEGSHGMIDMKLPYWAYRTMEPGDFEN